MPAFSYTAIGPGGEMRRGIMEAASETDAIARLQQQGSLPVRAEAAGTPSALAGLLRLGPARGLSRQDVADLVRELATMLGAGQDLDRALRYLQENATSPRTTRIATALRDAVRDGSPLSAALAQHQSSFSTLHIGMVRAGEAGGALAATLARLADLLDRQRSLAATVRAAMIYPALLLVAAILSVGLLITQVLPQFVPMFEQSGAKLPASTQFLIDTGAAVSAYGIHAIAALLLAILAVRALLRRPAPRLAADRAMLHIPVIGTLLRETLAARFTRVLGTLLTNGVALIPALDMVKDAVGNTIAIAAIARATAAARAGGGLCATLADAAVFPPRTIHLLRLGEDNAQLGAMALRAADIHEEQSRLATGRLVALLVPLITILMGAAVAGIVASLLTAMLSLNDLAGT